MTIKAIETVYNGYRFRSRLEARWAVFFDTLGVEYEYEPEGYELPDGGRYLPDFRLTRRHEYDSPLRKPVRCWVEIKGTMPPHEELLRLRRFVDAARIDLFLVIGTPDIPSLPADDFCPTCDYELWFFYGSDDSFSPWMNWREWVGDNLVESIWKHLVANYLGGDTPIKPPPTPNNWRQVIEADKKYYWHEYNKEHPHYTCGFIHKRGIWIDGERKPSPVFGDESNRHCWGYEQRHPACSAALLAARQARFEHGENGRQQ